MKMRKLTFLAFMLAMVISSFTYGQYVSVSATYSTGDIATDEAFAYFGDVSVCPGTLNVPVPHGAIVVEIDVSYDMTATDPAQISHQRSQLWIDIGSGNYLKEDQIYSEYTYSAGTHSYSRTGWNVAGQVPPPVFSNGLDFELHAGNTYYNAPAGCSTATNKVDDGTWTITVWHLPIGSPNFPSNPVPADGEASVGIDTDLTWDFGSSTDTYDLFFGLNNPPTTQVVFDDPATTGLYDPGTMAYGTTYYWYVVGKNATNNTAGAVWSFTTGCDDATMPLFENFDGVTAPDFPICWVPLSNGGDYTRIETAYDQWGGAYSDFNLVKFIADAEPSPELILVLPKIGTISDKYVSFYTKNAVDWLTGQPYPWPITVGTMSDPTDPSTFEAHSSYIGGADWTYFEAYLSDITELDEYIALKGGCPQYNEVYLEDVTIDLIPSCVHPIDMEMSGIQYNQATLNWSDINGATEWEIEYDTAGFTPDGVADLTVTTNPYTITGLTGDYTYDVYLRSNCGGGDYSVWWGPLTFTTLCDPFIAPFYEDLSSVNPNDPATNWPHCWFKLVANSWEFGGIWVNNLGSYNDPQNAFYYDAGDGEFFPDAQVMAISPTIDDDISTMRVVFDGRSTNAGYGGVVVGTMSDPTDHTTFVAQQSVTFTDEWQYYTVYFDTYGGLNTHIAIKADMTQSVGASTILHVDNLAFETIPTCIEPDYTFVDNISATSAWINWEDLNLASEFEIEVGPLGFVPGTGAYDELYTVPVTPASSHSYEMTGLSSATAYEVYMRANCGGGDYSLWSRPASFLTGFGDFTLPVNEDFEDENNLIVINNYANTVDWLINTDVYKSGSQCMNNVSGSMDDNQLIMAGIFDFTAKTDVMLSFWQIAKTDGNYDHCYVEISIDGGTVYTPLPESTYAGTGVYTLHGYNNPEGPFFDEDSYSDWGTSSSQIPDNSWWRKEYFDLTDYNTYDNVTIRFRFKGSSGTSTRAGWFIDDIAVETIGAPGFTVDPLTITEDATETLPANVAMTLGNTGSFPASYTANVVYDEIDLHSENFDSGIPGTWTINHYGTLDSTWTGYVDYTGYTFDNTPFAICNGNTSNENKPLTVNDELVSPVIDASAYIGGALQLEFDQAFDHYYNAEDTARVLVYDGTDWIEIYKAWNDDGRLTSSQNGVHKVYDVSQYANANFQVKFVYEENNSIDRYGYYYAIDNFRLRASMFPLGWLTVDGAEVTSGVALPNVDGIVSMIDVMMDATGLAVGTYTADILVTSTDAGNPSTTVPVTLNVIADIALPFAEDFTGIPDDDLPEGWSVINPLNVVNVTSEKAVFFRFDLAGEMIMATPKLNLTEANDVSFDLLNAMNGTTPQFEVGTMTDASDPSTFESIGVMTLDGDWNIWNDYSFDITGITGLYHVAFRHIGVAWDNVHLDNIVIGGYTISGNVTYANTSMTALENCSIELRDALDAVLSTTTTDAAGYYEFTGMLDGDYSLETSTTIAWGGLTMNDVQTARQYVTNDPPGNGITGLHVMAGDVNEDGGLLMNDVQAMWQEVTANPPGFTHFWIFETQDVTVGGGNVTNDYQGVCSGDTDGSYVPSAK